MRFTTICLIPISRQLEAFSSIAVQSLFLSQAVQTIGSTANMSIGYYYGLELVDNEKTRVKRSTM